MNRAYVYHIVVDGIVRYVGKGSGSRVKEHLKIARMIGRKRANGERVKIRKRRVMTTFACVWIGPKYGREYVDRLRNMIDRHMAGPWEFICLTDHAEAAGEEEMRDVRCFGDLGLETWFYKMLLFALSGMSKERTVYLDLDTVIVGSLAPLAYWEGEFGICENFTRLAGHPTWPCRYGSCAMSFAPGWGGDVWEAFSRDRKRLIAGAAHGDQSIIETLVPDAALLQRELPPGFFLNKRDLPIYPDAPPPEASIVVFGGKERPHNCEVPWVKQSWR